MLTARSIVDHGELVPKRKDLQVQSRARTDQQPERVEEGNAHDGSSLIRAAHNLNRHKVYRVFGRHSLKESPLQAIASAE
jgi:hypothetical protein